MATQQATKPEVDWELMAKRVAAAFGFPEMELVELRNKKTGQIYQRQFIAHRKGGKQFIVNYYERFASVSVEILRPSKIIDREWPFIRVFQRFVVYRGEVEEIDRLKWTPHAAYAVWGDIHPEPWGARFSHTDRIEILNQFRDICYERGITTGWEPKEDES